MDNEFILRYLEDSNVFDSTTVINLSRPFMKKQNSQNVRISSEIYRGAAFKAFGIGAVFSNF